MQPLTLPPLSVLGESPFWKLKWSKSVGDNKRVTLGLKLATLIALDTDKNETSKELILTSPCNGWTKERLIKPGPDRSIILTHSDAGRVALTFSENLECKHDVVLNGLCAVCGEVLKAQEAQSGKQMVSLGFVTAEKGLQVSEEVAQTLTAGKIGDLLSQQKLVLVLDLDNTLAHAHEEGPPTDMVRGAPGENRLLTRFDDELAVLMDTRENRKAFESVSIIDAQNWGPNRLDHFMIDYESDGTTPILAHYIEEENEHYGLASAIIEVLESQILLVQTLAKVWRPDGVVTQTYYRPSFFKLRPGVIKFLRDMSKLYELYMYTAGTMEHAESALKLLDPQRKFFGSRVFARTSLNGDGTKSLGQILPTDHEMIVVIDDTRRVWSPDVGLFVCYPYMWFHDYLWHFLVPTDTQPAETTMKLRAIQNALAQYSPKHLQLMHERLMKYKQTLKASAPAEHVAGELDNAAYVAHNNAAKEQMMSVDIQITEPPPAMGEEEEAKMLEEEAETLREEAETLLEESKMEGVPVPSLVEMEDEDVDLMSRLNRTWRELGLDDLAGPMPKKVVDSDTQMYAAISILTALHRVFFEVIKSQRGEDRVAVPSSRRILRLLRSRVLRGCVILYQGSAMFKTTDLYELSILSGAQIIFNTDMKMPTHIIPSPLEALPPPSSEYHIVDVSWLEYAVCNLSRPDEALFSPRAAQERRVFWDITRNPVTSDTLNEEPATKLRKLETISLDVSFDPESVISKFDLNHFAKESVARSTSFKEAAFIFPESPSELAADFLAELEADFH